MEYLQRNKRSGKWSVDEEEYANNLIVAFHAGELDIDKGKGGKRKIVCSGCQLLCQHFSPLPV